MSNRYANEAKGSHLSYIRELLGNRRGRAGDLCSCMSEVIEQDHQSANTSHKILRPFINKIIKQINAHG